MIHVIEKQKISQRVVHGRDVSPFVPVSTTSIVKHLNQSPSRRRPSRLPRALATGFRLFHPGLVYAMLLSMALLLFFLLLGAGISFQSNTALASIPLPDDGSSGTLLDEYMGAGALDKRGSNAPAQMLSRFKPETYTVHPGDTVSGIAESYGVRIDTIISYNGIRDVRAVGAGTVLLVPSFENGVTVDGIAYTVRRGDTLGAIAERLGVELPPILDANLLESDVIHPGDVLFVPGARMASIDLRRALGTLFIKPVVGRMTSPFGVRIDPFTKTHRMHYGVDWANVIGTPVHASNDGVVSTIGENSSFGKYIVIDHLEQFQTLYAHLSAWSVRKGQRVSQGTVIGKVGTTGKSTGPHLHFAIYKNYEPVDPLDYIY